ncbi:MAG: MBL fold metallo-hydrolase [Deltaproteobacteria bacterium]|nr:MBL fold metallo-hydrolase [Deltaproteobacteria bacterium]
MSLHLSRRAFLGAAGAALHACASTQRRLAPGVFAADPRVGCYVSSPWGFRTSSYWIEGPTGLLLIDTQFLPSAAERALAAAQEATGKRAELAVVLHANPDKYNGTGVYRGRGIRVVSARQVVERIPEIDVERRGFFAERYAPDYPTALTLPESFGDASTSLHAGGVYVRAQVLGPGCSNAHVVLEFDGHVFPGDLIASRNHAWLKEANIDAWLQRLEDLRALNPRFVHPGRGPSGGPELIDQQEEYLRLVQRLVAEAHPTAQDDEAAQDRVRAAVEARYPGYGFAVFLRLGVPAEWRRQGARAAQP